MADHSGNRSKEVEHSEQHPTINIRDTTGKISRLTISLAKEDDSGDSSKETENSHSNDHKLSDETTNVNDSNMPAAAREPSSSLPESTKSATSSSPKSQEMKEQSEHAQGRVIIRERVITKEQIGAFMDLGLGRGVDATNPTPWLNKSAFQVRQVTFDNIIGTEEGNLYQGFVNEVESTQNLQTSLKASIPLNQQVNLGIDSELSRSYSSTQKSVGRKIITRTIAFRANFDDDISEIDRDSQGKNLSICQVNSHREEHYSDNGHDQGSVKENGEKEHPEKQKKSQLSTQAKQKTFEDHLMAWILQRMKDDEKIKQIERKEDKSERKKSETPDGETDSHKRFDNYTIKELSEFCYKFVKTFSITHYVHSFELGASHYRVMSEEEYTLKISSKGNLGAAQMADIAIGVEGSKTSKKLQRQTTKIGRMKLHDDEDSKHEDESKQAPGQECCAREEEVKRGSIEEAVVGVKVHPISTLVVKDIKLQRALQDALQHFIQNKQKIKYGPFFICCNRESIFLSVSDSCQIEATQDIKHASKFYIVRCDEGDDHFFIVHEAPTSLQDMGNITKFEKMPPIPMYLRASMNWRRRSTPTKPLMMEMNVNSRLSIHSRRDKEFHPAKLTEWVSQKEVFFIKCKNEGKPFSKSSYLCIYQPRGDATYVTGCKPTIRSDDSKRFMLFRLIKLEEDEVTTCTSTSSTATFLIKFHQDNKDVFFKISEDCKEVGTTEEEAKASTFYLKVQKCNYFKVLYKNASDQVYHLYAPAKSFASSRLLLSPREDASAQSYMAFYHASHAPSHSTRLHQRELSDLLQSGKEDELHITCQCSVDSDSRHVSDLYVKQKENNSFHVKTKHGKTKYVEDPEKRNAEASSQQFTKFVLVRHDDSNDSQTSASKVSPSKESSQQVKDADIPYLNQQQMQVSAGENSEISSKEYSKQTLHSTRMDSETPSTEDSKQTQYSLSTSVDSDTPTKDLKQTQHSHGMVLPTTEDSKQIQHSTGMDSETPSTEDSKRTQYSLSTSADSDTPLTKDLKQIQHSHGMVLPTTEDSQQTQHSTHMDSETTSKDSKQIQHSSTAMDSETLSAKDSKRIPHSSTDIDSETPSTKNSKLTQHPTGITSASTEDSKQIQESAMDSKLEGMGQIDCHDNNSCTIL